MTQDTTFAESEGILKKPIDYENMTDEQILDRLLSQDVDIVPERTIPMERLGIPVTIRALKGKQVYRIREMCTQKMKTRHGTEEKLDDDAYNISLIVAATVKPNWGHPELLEKYKASSGVEVVKRMLLAGEVSLLGDVVLDVSGYKTEVQDIKNASKPEE